MEMFKSAKAACLRSRREKYLIAADDEEHVCQDCNGAARWTAEFVPDATAVLRLKSCYGRYLTVSNEPFLLGVTGHKVLQTLSCRPDSLVERERVCAKVSGSSSKPGLFELSMDTSFALRGILSGKDSVDGLRRPLSFEQLRGQKAVAQFPYGSPLLARPSNSLPGSRAIHGSRSVSDSAKGAFANRPLSPHIALKKPQISATYSISHRIFGGVVASVILASPILMKYSLVFDV